MCNVFEANSQALSFRAEGEIYAAAGVRSLANLILEMTPPLLHSDGFNSCEPLRRKVIFYAEDLLALPEIREVIGR
jgi:hypothetical protein